MNDKSKNCRLTDVPRSDGNDQLYALFRPAIILVCIIPNVVLAVLGMLLAYLSFNSSFMYRAGTNPTELLFSASMFAGIAVLNIFAIFRSSFPYQPVCRWLAVTANAGLLLYSLRTWKVSFERSSSLALPGESIFFGMIGLLSILALLCSRLTEPSAGRLRQLWKIAVSACLFLAVASWIVRPDQFSHYRTQAPIANHFESLGSGVGWDNWQVTSIYLKTVPINNDNLEPVSRLPELRSLYLSDTKVTDAGMSYVAFAANLEHLYLTNTQVSDTGLMKINQLKRLKNLWLGDTAVTDIGLVHLEKMTEIGYLDLSGTEVTDEGLKHLTHLDNMYYLHLPQTKVTKKGINWLHEKLPNCTIYGTPDGEGYKVRL